jgi:hypothetical protein
MTWPRVTILAKLAQICFAVQAVRLGENNRSALPYLELTFGRVQYVWYYLRDTSVFTSNICAYMRLSVTPDGGPLQHFLTATVASGLRTEYGTASCQDGPFG